MLRRISLNPFLWTALCLVAFVAQAIMMSAYMEGGEPTPLAVMGEVLLTLGVPTAFQFAVFDLASRARPQDGRGGWLYMLPVTFGVLAGIAALNAPPGEEFRLHHAFFILAGLSYLACIWKSAGILERADSGNSHVSGGQRLLMVLAMFYWIIGAWVLQGKFRRVAAKAPS
ncbi:hypothetical protein [Caulobacter sp. NIBR2454]|uniref:hypothetical protein n=1 Tax=Caulobacter sp. NIBR2454 TaxID=3015996 RepID=UPI0022B5E847|nr:hypothetical protein [Caulobacter sp. NIBR2454]